MIKIAALVALSAVACFARSPVLTEKACIDQPKILAEVAGLGIDAGLLASNHMKVKMNFAIVDVGANLKAFLRMDGAWLGSKDIAIKKAKTSTFFNMETGKIGALSQPGGPLYNIEHSNGGLITFPGGIPVKNCKGELIGAVGVSGSTVANDHAVAKAMVDAMEKHKDGTILRKALDTSRMNQELALAGLFAGFAASEDKGLKMDLAVVDVGANLKAFIRMDDAWLGSVDIAIKKAKTSAFFNMESGTIGTLSQPGKSLYNIEHSNGGLISFPGGIHLRNSKDELIGAVGVSGDSVANDRAVAQAMIKAMGKANW